MLRDYAHRNNKCEDGKRISFKNHKKHSSYNKMTMMGHVKTARGQFAAPSACECTKNLTARSLPLTSCY